MDEVLEQLLKFSVFWPDKGSVLACQRKTSIWRQVKAANNIAKKNVNSITLIMHWVVASQVILGGVGKAWAWTETQDVLKLRSLYDEGLSESCVGLEENKE